jgi:hypothetical protein
MKFKRHKLFDTGIIVYDGEYSNIKYRIVKRDNVWILMRLNKTTNKYYDTLWSSAGKLAVFKKYMIELIASNKI